MVEMRFQMPLAMHVPEGFLSPEVAAFTTAFAVVAVAYGARVARAEMSESRLPLFGAVAAFLFAAQMLNFPVAGGTSGHFLGAALAAVLLGPWMACLVVALVLAVQAFVFADGGIGALGANVLNMGVLGGLLAGCLLLAARRFLPASRASFLGSVGLVSWLTVMVAAAATSHELALSGTVSLATVLPAMLGVHALIGVGEALITVVAAAAVLAARPDLVALAPAELKAQRAASAGARLEGAA
jgi:cobalt/nickel transport system permease protein